MNILKPQNVYIKELNSYTIMEITENEELKFYN